MSVCDRCKRRPGKDQPSDGDAATLFAAAAHVTNGETGDVSLCWPCRRTLEAMSLRAAGLHLKRA